LRAGTCTNKDVAERRSFAFPDGINYFHV